MEQKSLRLKRLGIVALVFLAIFVVGDFVDLYSMVGNTIRNVGDWSLYGSWFVSIFMTHIGTILRLVKFVVLGIVLLRIARTNIAFSGENKNSLRWIGILEVAQAFFVLILGIFAFIQILDFLISCIAAIIWFCWPDSVEENPQNVLQSQKTAGRLHVVFIFLQTMIIIGAAGFVYSFIYESVLVERAFINFVAFFGFGIISSCCTVLYFNRIGNVFRSVNKGASKFDAANVKRIKTAAWIRIVGAGIMALALVLPTITSILRLLKCGAPVPWFSIVMGIITPLALPLAILFLAYAYAYEASTKLEVQSTDIQ